MVDFRRHCHFIYPYIFHQERGKAIVRVDPFRLKKKPSEPDMRLCDRCHTVYRYVHIHCGLDEKEKILNATVFFSFVPTLIILITGKLKKQILKNKWFLSDEGGMWGKKVESLLFYLSWTLSRSTAGAGKKTGAGKIRPAPQHCSHYRGAWRNFIFIISSVYL